MMNKLWWKILGDGEYNLILLHGWGLNAEIWHNISMALSSHFTLHLVDLPGFGRSYGFGAMRIEEMAEHVLNNAPNKSIWLGWSLGGLVASQIALMHPERVHALVTVASSPCFSAQKGWPGINPEILINFQRQIGDTLQRTIERFLSLQTIGAKTMKKDIRILKETVLSLPIPETEVLSGGLEILKKVDFRDSLIHLTTPHLRIYGYLDNLVPYKIASILDSYWPRSKSVVLKDAAHAPFISHPEEFCNAIITFNKNLL